MFPNAIAVATLSHSHRRESDLLTQLVVETNELDYRHFPEAT